MAVDQEHRDYLTEAQAIDRLTNRIEKYVDNLHDNGVQEEEALRMTMRVFVDDVLNLGGARQQTQADIDIGHVPTDFRRSATNFIKNYIRLVYRPESFESTDLTFKQWLEGDETLNRKVALPPDCPCKKKKPKDTTMGYPVPAQQTNQLYAVPTKVAGGY